MIILIENNRLSFSPAVDLITKTDFVKGLEISLEIQLTEGYYIIVPSTYDPNQESMFQLNCYSSDCQINIEKIQDEPTSIFKGMWNGKTAGGCINYSTWRFNPQYLVTLTNKTTLRIQLDQPQQGATSKFIGFYLIKGTLPQKRKILQLTKKDLIKNTEYSNLPSILLEVTLTVDQSPCIVIPSIFAPGAEGTFELSISGEGVEAKQLPEDGWKEKVIKGEWKGPSSCGRILADNKWKNNPRYPFSISNPARISILLVQSDKEKSIGIGFYIFRQDNKGNMLPEPISKSGFVSSKEVLLEAVLEQGNYIVMPATYDPQQDDYFTLYIFSDQVII